MTSVIDLGAYRQRRRDQARVAETIDFLVKDTDDGEWWAIQYLLVLIRYQAQERR